MKRSTLLSQLRKELASVDNEVALLEQDRYQLLKRNIQLRKNAAKLANEDLKKEIAELKERLKLSVVQLYSLKELEAYRDFCEEHEECTHKMKITSGKIPFVKQDYCGVGVSSTVECPVCHKTLDITDTSVW